MNDDNKYNNIVWVLNLLLKNNDNIIIILNSNNKNE